MRRKTPDRQTVPPHASAPQRSVAATAASGARKPVPGRATSPPGSSHGALSHAHAERVLGPAGLAAALRERRWVERWPGVVVPAHMAEDPWTEAAAALIHAGTDAVLSGLT